MKKAMFVAMASILMVLANISSAFACSFVAYQPKTPKVLQK